MKTNTLKNLSDQKLLELCQKYGTQARFWKQKFAGLLPEVHRRRLYEQKGYTSIFEFAAKFAGMSKEHVCRVLNLEKKFEETPLLQNLLVNGEVSVHKLARIASIATLDNEEILANQVKLLSKSALETLVRDEKLFTKNEHQNGLFKTNFEDTSVPGHNFSEELQFSIEVKNQLLELQQKGMNLNQLLQEFLDQRKIKIEEEKEEITQKLNNEEAGLFCKSEVKPSRYIPVKIRKILTKEFGIKCSIPLCPKPSQNIHHTQRFSLTHTHDPRYLAPMCKDHHLIAHSIDVKFQQKRLAIIG